MNTSHFFFDGYDIDNGLLRKPTYIRKFINEIQETVNDGKVTMVPYYNGIIKKDGGISTLIINNNFHFTCHTFSYKNTVFIDCYGLENSKEKLLPIILKYFKTNNYDLCINGDKKGNFGKHVIIKANRISYQDGLELIKRILRDIEMTPITDEITNYVDEDNYDIVQMIAESHISIHMCNGQVMADVFSCKDFDENKVIKLFGDSIISMYMVNRGVYYK